ncbi:MAG: CDP-alcohol phosphatidyltransferase family protein [Robiginitomaculum sp.]
MNTSTNKTANEPVNEPANETENGDLPVNTGGALADGLTLIRLILTPVIMFVIYKAWSGKPDDPLGFVALDLQLVLLASILFIIAAITDVLDDFIGGSADSVHRTFGWFDDIADSVLVSGTLITLMWVTHKAGLLHWTFALPAILLIGRDIIVALVKGAELSKFGFMETKLGDLKSLLAMFAACTLVAAPWLSNLIDGLRVSETAKNAMEVFNNPSPWVWNFGNGLLWAAALLSLITGYKILMTKPNAKEDISTS